MNIARSPSGARQSCGTPVTAEELQSLASQEISEEGLQKVAGGGSWLGFMFGAAKVGVGLLQGVVDHE